MFRLLELNLSNNKFFKNNTFEFTNDIKLGKGPYTSLILGPNGTGKSNLLNIIINIFREIESLKKNIKKNYVSGNYNIKFLLNNNEYYISRKECKKNLINVDFKELNLPENLIATSIMLNDKFPMIESKPNEIYQYMGVRRTPSSAGTKTFIRKIVSNIIECLDREDFNANIKEIIDFLEISKIYIRYYPRYRGYFYNNNLDENLFRKFFENWKENPKRTTAPWGLNEYNKIKDNSNLISELISFIKEISKNLKSDLNSPRSKYFEYELLNDKKITNDFKLINILGSLDLLQYPHLNIEKKERYVIEESSSGEYHFLASILAIMSKIKNNSLILIDEPEISLHPNWQMRYIDSLKKIFKNHTDSHFIITSHSHFLVSDLQNETSSIIGLKKENDSLISNLFEANTYGWSAEDILYNVFNVATTRNLYLSYEIGKIMQDIAENHDKSNIIERLKKINELKIELKDIDPLKSVIEKLNKKYLENLNE